MTQQNIELNNYGGASFVLNEGSTPAFTIKGLTAGSYRQSAKIDLLGLSLGTTQLAQLYNLYLALTLNGTPVSPGDFQIWVGFSDSPTAGTDNEGGCSGVDAAYVGYGTGGSTPSQSILQLDQVGAMPTELTNVQQSCFIGSFMPRARYCYFVILNNNGLAVYGSSLANLTIYPQSSAIQAAG